MFAAIWNFICVILQIYTNRGTYEIHIFVYSHRNKSALYLKNEHRNA